MSAFTSLFGESSVVTETIESTPDTSILTLEELFLAIDVSKRDSAAEVRKTVREIVKRAENDIQLLEYCRKIMLIAFKNRNHLKSQADGAGNGEREVFYAIILELESHVHDMVISILPLIPVYGSWKDLKILSERFLKSDDEIIPDICVNIANLFATQLKMDTDTCTLSEKALPSNACKYVFSESRNRGSKGKRSAAKASKTYKIQKKLCGIVADRIASGGKKFAQYRKYISALRKRLSDGSFMIDKYMCERTPENIVFKNASKSALEKYKKAINKNSEAKLKWAGEARKNLNAVSDIDRILSVVEDTGRIFANVDDLEDSDVENDKEYTARRILKAIKQLYDSRKEIIDKAKKLLLKCETSVMQANNSLVEDMINARTYPAIDTYGCSNHEEKEALLLAGYIIARAQGLNRIFFNGRSVSLELTSNILDRLLNTPKNSELVFTPEELNDLYAWFMNASFQSPEGRTEKDFADGILSAARAVFAQEGELQIHRDLLVFCQSVPNDPEIEAAVKTVRTECHFQAVLVHVLKAANVVVPYVPRPVRGVMPAQEDMVVDVVFLMDFTGSMGSYMDEAKRHINNIIASLKDDTKVKEIRLAFVGYRDFRDEGRFVVHDFRNVIESSVITDAIQSQEASGGNDTPEDVLGGILHCNSLSWSGDLRVVLFIADAPAHGYMDGSGDNFPGGKCPDQTSGPNLNEALITLRTDCAADLLFCECMPSMTKKMRLLFQEVYGAKGYGVLDFAEAGNFKETILNSLKDAICGVLVNTGVSGLQSFSGSNFSSVVSSYDSSVRETLDAISVKLNVTVATVVARTDYERLCDQLEAENLHPVRLLLGMPLAANLSLLAGKSLLNSGLTVGELEELGYPESIVRVFVEAAAKALKEL